MDLFVQSDSQLLSLTGLGFAPSHLRYWASLPTDVELYTADNPDELWTETAHPRFPLAGQDCQRFYLPLDVGALPQFVSVLDLRMPLLTPSFVMAYQCSSRNSSSTLHWPIPPRST